ncbi:ESX-1 secretion-associated protein EspB-like [Liolophura sinensis]|uniref:ESX-1 secretion-associated protein EspB-like n=1 Tax=Liolophura sinensis TaxID=3198878 RepID=UPI003158E3A5
MGTSRLLVFMTLTVCWIPPGISQIANAAGTGLNPDLLELELPDGVTLGPIAVPAAATTTTAATTSANGTAASGGTGGSGGTASTGGKGGSGRTAGSGSGGGGSGGGKGGGSSVLDVLGTLLGIGGGGGGGGGGGAQGAIQAALLNEIVEVDAKGPQPARTGPRPPDYEKEVELRPNGRGGLQSVVDVEGGLRKRVRQRPSNDGGDEGQRRRRPRPGNDGGDEGQRRRRPVQRRRRPRRRQ